MTSKEKASVIETQVNDTCFKPKEVALELSKIHRYLRGQAASFCYYYLLILAKDYENGNYDGRDESACKMAHDLFKGDENVEELYRLFFQH